MYAAACAAVQRFAIVPEKGKHSRAEPWMGAQPKDAVPQSKSSILFSLAMLTLLSLSTCNRRTGLDSISYGGSGPPTLVLLHGYGSSAERWVPFTETIRLPPNGRFVFPQAPEVTIPPDGPSDGRAWWRLDLRSHVPAGAAVPDLSTSRLGGLTAAAALVEDAVARIERSTGGPILLGGFSQGAMVASEVAFRSRARIGALILLSGTTVDEASWERGLAERRDMPVFVSHGRADGVLPFAVADRFRRKMEAAGMKVTWVPFGGEHEMPAAVVDALNRFLQTLPLPIR